MLFLNNIQYRGALTILKHHTLFYSLKEDNQIIKIKVLLWWIEQSVKVL